MNILRVNKATATFWVSEVWQLLFLKIRTKRKVFEPTLEHPLSIKLKNNENKTQIHHSYFIIHHSLINGYKTSRGISEVAKPNLQQNTQDGRNKYGFPP